jgi:ethanolamine utilization protein EutM
MLARRLPSILPPLAPTEAIEVTRIQSVAGLHHGGGLVTTVVSGDVGSVRAAVEAGASAARQVGELTGSHVIPRPAEGLMEVYFS